MASKGPRSKLDHETRAKRQKVRFILHKGVFGCVLEVIGYFGLYDNMMIR